MSFHLTCNKWLAFDTQICRVEDIVVSGLVQGTVINFNRARNVTVRSSGTISATGLGNFFFFAINAIKILFSVVVVFEKHFIVSTLDKTVYWKHNFLSCEIELLTGVVKDTRIQIVALHSAALLSICNHKLLIN